MMCACALHSASLNRVFWNSISALPNALRSLQCLMVMATACSVVAVAPTDDAHALIGQLLHHLVEAAAFFAAQKIRGRNAHIVEEQLAGVLTVHADFFKRAADAITLQILGLDHHQRDAFRARAGLRRS